MTVTYVGIDLGKLVFHLVGQDKPEVRANRRAGAKAASFFAFLTKAIQRRLRSPKPASLAKSREHVSKKAFDFGWMAAIEDTGRHDWYQPLRGPGGRARRSMLTDHVQRLLPPTPERKLTMRATQSKNSSRGRLGPGARLPLQRNASELVLCQELGLVVLHKRQQPVAALLPLRGKSLREFLAPTLRHRALLREG
jgi:hypothetical protein